MPVYLRMVLCRITVSSKTALPQYHFPSEASNCHFKVRSLRYMGCCEGVKDMRSLKDQ